MPFKSEAQRKLCYLLKNKGESGSWDCDEWSASTGKKKLPEHVKKQTEKDAALEAVIKLARCWAGYEPVPGKEPYSNDSCRPKSRKKKDSKKEEKKAELFSIFSKMSAVATSPGRGSGDEEETAINPDSSEGMQKTKPVKPVPGKMSFNAGGSKPVSPRGAARNAAARASISVLGFDPRGGSVKRADGPAAPQPAPKPAPAAPQAPAAPKAPAAPQASAPSQGPVNMLGQAWQHRGAIAPVAANAVRAGLGSNEAMTSLQNDANRFNFSAARDKFNNWMNKTKATAQQAEKNYEASLSWQDKIRLASEHGLSHDKIVAGERAKAQRFLDTISGVSKAVAHPFTPFTQAATSAVNNYAADSEARRMTAGYGLQAAQFMRNNPFLTAGLGGLGALGLYKGISGLFGGGSGDEQKPTMQDHFEQGYAEGNDPRRRRRPAA